VCLYLCYVNTVQTWCVVVICMYRVTRMVGQSVDSEKWADIHHRLTLTNGKSLKESFWNLRMLVLSLSAFTMNCEWCYGEIVIWQSTRHCKSRYQNVCSLFSLYIHLCATQVGIFEMPLYVLYSLMLSTHYQNICSPRLQKFTSQWCKICLWFTVHNISNFQKYSAFFCVRC